MDLAGTRGIRIAIVGNSGSGKSTLARWLADRTGVALLDLDTVAWESGHIAVSRPMGAAEDDVRTFCRGHSSWVVEGCYAHLVRAALEFGPRLIFLNPGEAECLANCRSRPWEPHKYASKAEQDERLAFLLEWVSQYYGRSGEMSLTAHAALYAAYDGVKHELADRVAFEPPPAEILAWLA